MVVISTPELSIRVKNSTATFVKPPSHPTEVVIDTSKLSIMVRESTVIFVKPPSNPIVIVITTSEIFNCHISNVCYKKECNLGVFIYYNHKQDKIII